MSKIPILNRDSVICVLNTLISPKYEHQQGYHLYVATQKILTSNHITPEQAFDIYRNYCGYLAYGDFSDDEYKQVKLIADYFYKLSNNI